MDEAHEERPYLADSSVDDLCRILAEHLRAERLRRNLTQEATAALAGLALRTYRRIERSGDGSIVNLMALLKAFRRQALAAVLFPAPSGTSHASGAVRSFRQRATTTQRPLRLPQPRPKG